MSKDDQEILHVGNLYALLYVGIGIVTGISSFFQKMFGGLAGDRFSLRIRKLVFKNMLAQDMTYFDEPENTVGNLTARLSTDATGIQGVKISDKLHSPFTSMHSSLSISNLNKIGYQFEISWTVSSCGNCHIICRPFGLHASQNGCGGSDICTLVPPRGVS